MCPAVWFGHKVKVVCPAVWFGHKVKVIQQLTTCGTDSGDPYKPVRYQPTALKS